MNKQILFLLSLALSCSLTVAQDLDPGFIDPAPILAAASAAIGEQQLNCVSISGTAYTGMVGQQRLNGYEVDWPRGEPLRNYTRIIDWQNVRMLETFDREPGNNPASWKYGLGWRGGTPVQQNERQEFMLNGSHGWHKDGTDGAPIAAPPLDAERWQLDMWLTPHGFSQSSPSARRQSSRHLALGVGRNGTGWRNR